MEIRIQPQRPLPIAALGDEVGLVDGKALADAVVHNVLELVAAPAPGVVAHRGGNVGKGLPVGVPQPEEGRAVGVLVVPLTLHGGDKAPTGQLGVPDGLGGGNATACSQPSIGGVLAGDGVGPLPRLNGSKADRPQIPALPKAGDGHARTVGVGEDCVDLGGGKRVFVVHRAVQSNFDGRPHKGGLMIHTV